jgi:hypothetical protein
VAFSEAGIHVSRQLFFVWPPLSRKKRATGMGTIQTGHWFSVFFLHALETTLGGGAVPKTSFSLTGVPPLNRGKKLLASTGGNAAGGGPGCFGPMFCASSRAAIFFKRGGTTSNYHQLVGGGRLSEKK